jgi:hypothetical protein
LSRSAFIGRLGAGQCSDNDERRKNMAKRTVVRKPEITGSYHEGIKLRDVRAGVCDLCKKDRATIGRLEIPEEVGTLVLQACPVCLIEIARDILSS